MYLFLQFLLKTLFYVIESFPNLSRIPSCTLGNSWPLNPSVLRLYMQSFHSFRHGFFPSTQMQAIVYMAVRSVEGGLLGIQRVQEDVSVFCKLSCWWSGMQ